MTICGLKLTHDGAVAVVENGRLLFSIEIEKLGNNLRYCGIEDTAVIEQVLKSEGMSAQDVDRFVIDGWGGDDAEALAVQPRLEIGKGFNLLSVKGNGVEHKIRCSQYEELTLADSILAENKFSGLVINNKSVEYSSYLHVTGHVLSAYCTSPFAKEGRDAFVLVWDGGMYPRLYHVDAKLREVENLGPIFLYIGNVYTIFSQHFGPFKVKGNFAKDDLSIAGKVMAYIALGTVRHELLPMFDKIYSEHYDSPMGFANVLASKFKEMTKGEYSDEDILSTFHVYLERLLVAKLEKKVYRYKKAHTNLCIAGGCALNIKWNSAIRQSELFENTYVPPFPNDSGSAIGMACTHMIKNTKHVALEWSVYGGPNVIQNRPAQGWAGSACTISELANFIFKSGEPVVFMNGRAELGPRALGNRSILGSPTSLEMKNLLNEIKQREPYRPVSPICLETDAPDIFSPGSPDPYMLFDHETKENWISKIPAVVHLDNTARLQTVNSRENAEIAELLTSFKELSGIPLLCNTSANYKGKGFFPDVLSATSWGGVNAVWSNGILYKKN